MPNFKERIPEPESEALSELYRLLTMRPEPSNAHPTTEEEASTLALSFAQRFAGCTFLEVGASTGKFAGAFARYYRQGRVIGIDTDKEAVALARKRNSGLPHLSFLEMSIYEARAQRAKLGDAPIAMVYSKQTLHHLPEVEKALEIMCQLVTIKEGAIMVHDFDRELAMQQLDKCGLTPRQQETIYRSLKKKEPISKTLSQMGLTNNPKVLTFFSFLASYSGDSAMSCLAQRGFDCQIGYHPENAAFALIAVKQ